MAADALNVDAFLAYYFRQHERRSSPRALSYDGERATSHEADRSNAKYIWAISILGTLEHRGELTKRQMDVLRAYYLSLANHHVAIVHDRFGVARPKHRPVIPGSVVPVDDDEVADLVSFVSWSKMVELLGYARRNRAAAAILRREFRTGRSIVSKALTIRQESP